MDESILTSVKLALGITEEYTAFDDQLILYINSVLGILAQTGVGVEGFRIIDKSAVWSDFLGDKLSVLEYSKSYVVLRVKMLFDPPQSSGAMSAMKEMIQEFEWRGYVECDSPAEAED